MKKPRGAGCATAALLVCACTSCTGSTGWDEPVLEEGQGALRITVRDGDRVVPARLELMDDEGNPHFVPDAVPVGGDCEDHDRPLSPVEARDLMRAPFHNSVSDTLQFYTTGRTQLALRQGTYTLKALKGPEYRMSTYPVQIDGGRITELQVQVEPWIRMAERGWYSADAHLHIPRPDPSQDSAISAWMRAEGLNVANLLQWGNSRGFNNAVQFAYGADGTHADADVLLLPGQENPRTGLLGHAMILAPDAPIRYPDEYLVYRRFFEQARDQGAIAGVGHKGNWGGYEAVGLLAPRDLIDFIEVFTFRTPDYDLWYETLNAGFRIAAVAGSDFPCGRGGVPPGEQRFYVRSPDPLTAESWKAGLAAGRTFVTNGPMIEFAVEGREMGDEVTLDALGNVTAVGKLLFDPDRDRIRVVDLLLNGRVVQTFSTVTGAGQISFSVEVPIEGSSWLAMRSFGTKLNTPSAWRNSFAHSGPVFVEVRNFPALRDGPRARAVVQTWLDRLSVFQGIVTDENQLAQFASAASDGTSADVLIDQRFNLLREIQESKWLLQSRLQQ